MGNEWTNLFPTCSKCNNNKEDIFEIKNTGQKVTTPPVYNGVLNRALCLATHSSLLSEEPKFLHPEVDTPELFFKFCPDGTLKPLEGLSNWNESRAKTMIDKFLGTPAIVEKRKKYIDGLVSDLANHIENFGKELDGAAYTSREIRLGFNPFFKKLLAASAFESEFSRLGFWMSECFENFFLQKYPVEVQELVLYAMQLFCEEYFYLNK